MSAGCPEDELLAGFVDRTLSVAEQEQVERHIDGCASCRGLVAELMRADHSEGAEESDAGLLDTLASPFQTGTLLLAQGEKVGRFIVLDRLGVGGMGVVYAAHDPQLDRKVALKLLRADVAQGAPGDEARQRLLREAKAMARLDHPNVIGVHDTGTFGDEIFVAVEFVDGVTLRGWREQKPRSWREVLATYLQAGRGLAAAHAAGLVHRDFKPENALIGKDGRVRVTDFGLVRAAGNLWPSLTPAPVPVGANLPLEAALTRANAILGTPAYMAPEQLEGKGADERSDQFSFSVSLFEALYGTRPYPGKTLEEVRRQVKRGKPAFPVTSKVPFRVRRVLAKGLSPSPFDRHSSMETMLTELHRARVFVARRSIALALTGGLAVVAAGVAVWPRGAGPCSGSEQKLAGVWDSATQGRVRAAVLGAGHPEAVWQGLESQLGEWSRNFVQAHREACEATRLRGEQSDAMLDARMFCLEGRLKEGRALVEVLAGGKELPTEVGQELSPLAACSDLEALRLGLAPPADVRVRARVDELQERLAEVKAQRAAGAWVRARELAARLDQRSAEVDYPPLRAEILFQRGVLESLGGDEALAERLLEEAMLSAESARDDALVANAALSLIQLVGVRQGRLPEAMRLARRVEGKVNRLGGDRELRARLERVLGELAPSQATAK